jgi:hypothetical protein
MEHRDGEYGGDVVRAQVGAVDGGVLHDEVAIGDLCSLGEAGPAEEKNAVRGQLRRLEGYARTWN